MKKTIFVCVLSLITGCVFEDSKSNSNHKKSGVQMPDPVKNDATIAGVDSDNDGIRDDIQVWIDTHVYS
ncbi:hypothetical protein ACJVC5_14030 [Peredibacter sp. HCB2-198]|uniref:hypothetical protein n=1 Tax=Peredibacter sp. HCB2-198 TaxID=3383025 RepID=UPI0038B69976